MVTRQVQKFISLESAGGILLFAVLIAVLIIANSPLADLYDLITEIPIQIRVGNLEIHKPVFLWVNDGLMAVFFMLLALEIKREIYEGELSQPTQLALPIMAAIGGIAFPALIYYAINYHSPTTITGWPIATTTDIAFTLGMIAILGKRVPTSLKVFLVALSIVDDILAVVIIALFYTTDLSTLSLVLAGCGVVALLMINVLGVKRIAPYMLIGVFIWVCVLKSGVHATLAGVVVGLMIPMRGKNAEDHSPLRHLEHAIHPWVAYFILPVFVFMNGGISFAGMTLGAFLTPVPLGVSMGLFLGKSIGVFICSAFVIKIGFAKLPTGSNWVQLFALCAMTGIGFTMSLFLASLAFFGTPYEQLARQGVLLGSFLSAVLAISVFEIAYQLRKRLAS